MALALPGVVCALDPKEIVRRSVSHDQMNWEKAKDYTYISNSTLHQKDSAGKVFKTEQETREYFLLYGEPYARVIAKDGKPLPADDARKEQQKIDRLAAKRRSETPAERAERIERWKKERLKQREVALEIPEAFDFTLVREEVVAGRKAWVIDAEPRPGYQPKNWRASMLKKFHGRMWIDQTEYQWVRMEGEAIDTVSFGLFLARLAKGSKIIFEQVRVNDEVWMPKYLRVDLDARLALLKRMIGDQEVKFSEYRKFHTESRIVSMDGEAR